ncbi:hypothetical protein [Nonomuraea sp. NPDC002799]
MQPICTVPSGMPGTESTDNPLLTPEPARRVVENDQYVAFLRRAIRAYGRRIATGDVEALADAVALINDLDTAITQAVVGLREQGYSWAEIARPLAITRQAAQQRWGGENA